MAPFELELIDYLRSRSPIARWPEFLALGIGDDMAALCLAGMGGAGRTISEKDLLLVSSDMLLDGVHFDAQTHSPETIGRKAIACSLSDCAAMAVQPLAATVSLALPVHLSPEAVRELMQGMWRIASEYDLAIVGGDTNRWPQGLAIDVTVLAVPFPGVDPIARRGARLGDVLAVTGKLGGSLLGHHLSFTPRVREAHALAQALGPRLHAMLDISDGLSLDLWRLCEASAVGAELDDAALETVVSDDARRAASIDGRPAMEHALSDGEDFELLVALEPPAGAMPDDLLPIGRVIAQRLWLRRRDGGVEALEPRGYVH